MQQIIAMHCEFTIHDHIKRFFLGDFCPSDHVNVLLYQQVMQPAYLESLKEVD